MFRPQDRYFFHSAAPEACLDASPPGPTSSLSQHAKYEHIGQDSFNVLSTGSQCTKPRKKELPEGLKEGKAGKKGNWHVWMFFSYTESALCINSFKIIRKHSHSIPNFPFEKDSNPTLIFAGYLNTIKMISDDALPATFLFVLPQQWNTQCSHSPSNTQLQSHIHC